MKSKSPKIAVIGAGLSGLTAAYRLFQKGYDVELFEARERVGGRVFTIYLNGHVGELGGQNIRNGGEAENLLNLAHELNCETHKSQTALRLHYFENGKITDIHPLIQEKRFRPDKLKADLDFVCKTARNMKQVLLYFFAEDDLLYKACMATLAAYEGAPLEKLSPLYSETLYHFLLGGFCAAHQNHGEEVYHFDQECIKEGNGLLCEKLGQKLGKRLHLNHVLSSIGKNSESFSLQFKNGKKAHSDLLVLTIPCSVYKDVTIEPSVIPEEKCLDIESIGYGTNAKILVPLTSSQAPAGGFYNGRVVSFLSDDHHSVNLFYTELCGCFTKETIGETFRQEIPLLEKVYHAQTKEMPKIAEDKSFVSYKGAVGHNWLFDPFAKGSYSCIGPNQEKVFVETVKMEGEEVKTLFTPIAKSLFFAGEHTSTLQDIRGTMEAAVESGEKAVRLIEKFYSSSR